VGLGTHTITVTATDAANNHTAKTVTFTVIDNTPPTITIDTDQHMVWWPPNHRYETVTVSDFVLSAGDACDSGVNLNAVYISKATSDEAENGNGSGNTLNDIIIAPDCKSVRLRVEREGGGDGRVYTITFKVKDASGNFTTATAKTFVPKNGNENSAVDSGPHYTVVSACP
jgi:hypothetical protein